MHENILIRLTQEAKFTVEQRLNKMNIKPTGTAQPGIIPRAHRHYPPMQSNDYQLVFQEDATRNGTST
jgi:hypothetical protein